MAAEMFPKLNLNQMVSKLKNGDASIVPIVPPRVSNLEMWDNVPNVSNKPSWYVVFSPRETKGIAGPFSLLDIKRMYRHEEITEQTLCWHEGDRDWLKLMHHNKLKDSLVHIPMVPPRVGTYNEELNVFDPHIELPPLISDDKIKPIEVPDLNKHCHRCGNVATADIIGIEAPHPDLWKCREVEGGSTKNASEILPGFLWIGDSGSGKKGTIQNLNITLVINCAVNMRNIPSELPNFRCRDIPIPAKPAKSLSQQEKDEVLDLLERACDWIETERIDPGKGRLIDAARGEVGHYNPAKRESNKLRALKGISNGKDKSQTQGAEARASQSLPRVLLWSRLGSDRSCLVASAYLIRSYGMSVTTAIEIIRRQRPQIEIAPQYMNLLDVWAARFSLLGAASLCIDCAASARAAPKKKVQFLGSAVNMDMNAVVVSEDALLNEQFILFEDRWRKTSRCISQDTGSSVLTSVSEFITKIPMGYSFHSGWSGLIDLTLEGRALADSVVAQLFDSLAMQQLLPQIRILQLRNNKIHHLAIIALLNGLFPVESPVAGDYFFDERLRIKDIPQNANLTVLDLSYNELHEAGSRYLCYLLKKCNTITSLYLDGNQFGDDVTAEVLSCFKKPGMQFMDPSSATSKTEGGGAEEDLFKDEEELRNLHNQIMHNYSVTDLSIGDNGLMEVATEALTNLMKSNGVIRSLKLQLVPEIPVENLLKVFRTIRVYNSSLEDFSLAETPLSVKTAAAYLRIAESDTITLRKIDLHNCKLRHLHIETMPTALSGCTTLKFLDLHNNNLGEKGAAVLASLIAARREEDNDSASNKEENKATLIGAQDATAPLPISVGKVENKVRLGPPPLTHIDLRCCGLGSQGVAILSEAIARSPHRIQYLDLSENKIGSDNTVFFENISHCDICELRISNCSLQSKGAVEFFRLLSVAESSHHSPSPGPGRHRPHQQQQQENHHHGRLAKTLRSVRIADNNISDSAVVALCQLLESNLTLQFLDLGFNQLTDLIAEDLRAAIMVGSESPMAKKVLGLTVNLIGNPCEPYLLDTPGFTRSKSSFQSFGTRPGRMHAEAGGFDHMSERARGQFLVRKELHDQFQIDTPPRPVNSLL